MMTANDTMSATMLASSLENLPTSHDQNPVILHSRENELKEKI